MSMALIVDRWVTLSAIVNLNKALCLIFGTTYRKHWKMYYSDFEGWRIKESKDSKYSSIIVAVQAIQISHNSTDVVW